MIYNQVIVVEGKHDEQKIKSIFPEIDCIVTNGSEVSKETLNLIYETSLVREVILFLDPDYPGKKITSKILETNGIFKIAYINKEKAISKNNKKVGIEHASEQDIKKSLLNLFTVRKSSNEITYRDLANRSLVNSKGSKLKRQKLCKALIIPPLNGKAILKSLNMLGIKLSKIDSILERN